MNPAASFRPLRLLTLALLPGLACATTYHVEILGVDGAARTSSITQPWRSLSYAATRATVIGDLIQIGAGTFEESATTSL